MLKELIHSERLMIMLMTHFMTICQSADVRQILANVRFQSEKNLRIYQKILAAKWVIKKSCAARCNCLTV